MTSFNSVKTSFKSKLSPNHTNLKTKSPPEFLKQRKFSLQIDLYPNTETKKSANLECDIKWNWYTETKDKECQHEEVVKPSQEKSKLSQVKNKSNFSRLMNRPTFDNTKIDVKEITLEVPEFKHTANPDNVRKQLDFED